MKANMLVAQLCPTLCDPMYEIPLSMRFSRQERWSGLPFPYPGDLPDPGLKPESPALQAILYHLSHQGSRLLQIRGAGLTWEAHMGPGT